MSALFKNNLTTLIQKLFVLDSPAPFEVGVFPFEINEAALESLQHMHVCKETQNDHLS